MQDNNTKPENEENNNKPVEVGDVKIETTEIIKEEIPISKTLARRDKIFLRELEAKRREINFTTTIYYKTGIAYQKGKIVISGNCLYVIALLKDEANVNVNNPKLAQTTEIKAHPFVAFNFNLLTAKLIYNHNKQNFQIYVLGYNNHFEFYAKLPLATFEELIKKIQLSIETSNGYINNLVGVSLRDKFYLNYYISEDEFLSKAKSGDVLIFRGLGCPAKSQRFFTGDDYDHVALLLKRGIDIWVYEATSHDGCKARTWREFSLFGWNLLYEKMTYRQLIVKVANREEVLKNISEKLEEFVGMTQRKKYKLTACGLCCKLNSQDFEKNNQWNKAEGFFCSQLVFASYLHSGILRYSSDTRSYLPGNFSKDYILPFNTGFELGPEYILEFSE